MTVILPDLSFSKFNVNKDFKEGKQYLDEKEVELAQKHGAKWAAVGQTEDTYEEARHEYCSQRKADFKITKLNIWEKENKNDSTTKILTTGGEESYKLLYNSRGY